MSRDSNSLLGIPSSDVLLDEGLSLAALTNSIIHVARPFNCQEDSLRVGNRVDWHYPITAKTQQNVIFCLVINTTILISLHNVHSIAGIYSMNPIARFIT